MNILQELLRRVGNLWARRVLTTQGLGSLEDQAEWEAFLSTCRRRDHELLSRAWPGYAEELPAARRRRGWA